VFDIQKFEVLNITQSLMYQRFERYAIIFKIT